MQKRREIASSDPMPTRIEPCLALLVPRPPKGEGWAYEVKWDGYRLVINVDQVRSKVLTRNGHDWTSRFQHLADAAAKLGHNTMILDGEGVVLDAKGRSDFSMLQKALGGRGGRRFAHEAVFFAFDILYLDGRDLRSMPLSERRELLKQVISDDQTGTIRLSEEVDAAGVEFFKIACEHGLEGIVAKRLDAPYRSGRHGEWQKIKCVQSESFQIVGYEPSDAMRGAIGRLLLAARKGGKLVYVGGVGTGFKHKEARDLKSLLDQIPAEKPPVALKRKNAVFARPTYVAEIEFRGWTDDQKLRHASYKGIREPEDNDKVFEIEAIRDPE